MSAFVCPFGISDSGITPYPTGIPHIGSNQRLRMAHVANHKGVRQGGQAIALAPVWGCLIKAAGWDFKVQEGAQAGLPQPAKTANQNQVGW